MSSTPVYAGFDLGTTNSAAAVFDGRDVKVMRNSSGAALTPSVVRVDKRGRVSVGHKAAKFADRDPDNVHREFKRLMGTAQRLGFAGSDKRWLPEELAALILEALRADVEDVVGVRPSRAVISVPALFELPQSKATARAAELAGFEQVELLQEPIASALAAGWRDDDHGSWLVYDLGGGTFDVSLLETRDGLLRVVGHDGDNFLGGRDFDHAIADWAIAELANNGGDRVERSNPAHAPALAALRTAAEAAKIELSRADRAELLVDVPIEVDLELDRETFEAICAPLVARTIAVCRRLLESHGLHTDQLSRVVLVGGPSVTPLVRREVEAALATDIATGFDPMTLVAQGAALYAATVGLDGRPPTRDRRRDRQRVFCQYPPVSADLEPHVIGRFDTSERPAPASVELVRLGAATDGGEPSWRSGFVGLDEQDAFVISVLLEPRAANRFRIEVRGENGEAVATEPSEITIIQGLTIGDPPLSRSIGVALANNVVHTYFERGTALPARRTFTHHTIETVAAGTADSVISIPIVQGEFDDAHLCRLVGSLSISGRDLDTTIPSGTPVEMSITVDRGGKMSASARIEGARGTLQFERVAQLVVPEANIESLDRNLGAARARVADALSEAFADGDPQIIGRLQSVDQQLGRAETLIEALSGGDSDAGQRASRIILDADAELSEIDAERKWPEFEADATDTYAWAVSWVGEHGRESEQRMLDKAGTAMDQALSRRSVSDVNRQLRVITRLGAVCFRRDPETWRMSFTHLASRIDETTDLPRAKELEAQGKRAMAEGDNARLRSVVEQMRDLLPADPVARRMSYDSGVQ